MPQHEPLVVESSVPTWPEVKTDGLIPEMTFEDSGVWCKPCYCTAWHGFQFYLLEHPGLTEDIAKSIFQQTLGLDHEDKMDRPTPVLVKGEVQKVRLEYEPFGNHILISLVE